MKPADQTVLENFMKSPGLQHLAENILLNLDYQTLEHWGDINQVFKQFLNVTMNNPMFWLKRFIQRGLSKKNQEDWLEVIQMTRDGRLPANIKKHIVWHLKMYSKNERVVDFDVQSLRLVIYTVEFASELRCRICVEFYLASLLVRCRNFEIECGSNLSSDSR